MAPSRFVPGTVLGGRYRLVGLIGRGGMGDVYRADDTRLGQPVALKFLPEAVARDPARRERFYAEVRIGRQVSHPNVCRLYDLVELDGQHCLSMEYVDGEDLASLLRRIGRLPSDKALEIARDVCSGLAAAHDKGVIHRDLKPANVMIDGRGRARIADFGLAALAEEALSGALAGTPAYMAPEQLDGKEATVRSDLYALGLVLYETFTGKRLFDATSVAELRRLQAEMRPPSLSSSVRDVDPAVERVLLRCLERDPSARPPSARAVLAALPAGDPLEAALAAGETPSPEMVAAAGKVGDLAPNAAWAGLLLTLAGCVAVAFLAGRTTIFRKAALPKPPEVLAERAREILARLGYGEEPLQPSILPTADSACSFLYDWDYLDYVEAHDTSPRRWDTLATARPGPLLFYCRRSPWPLVAWGASAKVERDDPPMVWPGMAEVVLDARGRLTSFRAVPPRIDLSKPPWGEPDWSVFFAEAGLPPAGLKPANPVWTPPFAGDSRASWHGAYPGQPDVRIQIEAAAYRGRPVWFEVQGPWGLEGAGLGFLIWHAKGLAFIGVIAATLLGGVLLVRRNVRLGGGDLRGAFRLALFIFCASAVGQLLDAHHVPSPIFEFIVLRNASLSPLLSAAIAWLAYLALEPYVRRRWPHVLISWSRLLTGRFRDPLVGRDVLIGTVAGTALAILWQARTLAPAWLGMSPLRPNSVDEAGLSAARHVLAGLFATAEEALSFAIVTNLFMLLLLRVLVRSQWLALALIFPYAVTHYLSGESLLAQVPFAVASAAITLGVLLRCGLLSLVVAVYVSEVLGSSPLTLDPWAWYGGRSLLVLLFIGGLAVYAFRTSLAGKPLLGRPLLEE